MSTATASTATINPKLIVPFVASVRTVLQTMLSLETTIERPAFKTAPGTEYDYSGIIAFSGNIVGTVVVSFQKDAAVKMVEAFAGSPIAADSADFSDALGELTNMIAGAAKKDLGGVANISVPTVIMGRGHIVARPSDIPCLVVKCNTKVGDFAIEISIKAV
jgi:chemotaxis protein CheX